MKHHREKGDAMPVPVKLREVAGEMDAVLESWTAYLNRQTGEIYSFPDELEALDEDDLDEEDDELDVDFPPEELPKVREILGSEDWLPLPTKFDIHEWNIMRGFCDTVADAGLRDELQEAIRALREQDFGVALHFGNYR